MPRPRLEMSPSSGALRIADDAAAGDATLLDTPAAALAVVDETATILRANGAWAAFTARGGPLGVGDDYLDLFRRRPVGGGSHDLIPAGIADVLRGDAPAFRSEYPHAVGGRRWLIGVECRPLPGTAPREFLCLHEHVASAPGEGAPGAFQVALDDIGDGLRRFEAVLRTMVPRPAARPRPERVAVILADIAAAAGSGAPASLAHALTDAPDGVAVTMQIGPGPFGAGPVATGTITLGAASPAADRREAPSGDDHAAAALQGMSEGVFTLDADGLFRFVNTAAEGMLGWTRAELAGRPVARTIGRRPAAHAGRRRHSRLDRARARHELVRVQDDVFMRRDGVEIPVAYTVTPLSDGRGGSVVVFSAGSGRAGDGAPPHGERAHAAIVARVRQALTQDDFVLYAQPVYDLRTMEVHSHELLIRMREPTGHLRSPAQFLPVAERSGLIVEIDEWVIRQGAELSARGHAVSLNVSAASVGTPGFIDTVAEIFDVAGADPRRVIMELTETAVVRDERPAREFIDAMRALGCEFALDDFGTGYGGFTYIKHLAIDYLKIDKEFVRDLDRDTSSRHVVEVIVSLAGRFGLRTVAEGVESRACLEVLSDLGVDYAQGYRLKRPAPLARAFGA